MRHGARSGCRLFSVVAAVCAVGLAAPVWAQNNACDQPGEAPDVIVGSLHQVGNYGNVGGVSAFSVGTTSCNVGSCWLNWIEESPDHPVIGQNMYRLRDGQFEQIGQSWLKHGFTALSQNLCSPDCISTSGTHLGVNCSDPYSAGLNGQQSRLGPKFEVNATTGVFPWPPTNQSATGNAIFKRLQVDNVDLDPASNPGALYYVEGQYVTADDAAAGNDDNNASYRPVVVSEDGSGYDISLTGSTVQEQSAIWAWAASDPEVQIEIVDVPGDGRFLVASKASFVPGQFWRYEYAVQNLNSHRSAMRLSVPIPPGAGLSSVGFHDVPYHSGEPFDGTDWTFAIVADRAEWATQSFAENPDANALRWGTLYNFRFSSPLGPTSGAATLALFRPGSPTEVGVSVRVPEVAPCDDDGICESSEDCLTCPGDCLVGANSCCGDEVCEGIEDSCNCTIDCGPAPSLELICDDGIDADCDAAVDCDDPDCCVDESCDGPDLDVDGVGACHDCTDADGDVWSTPGEVSDVLMGHASGVTTWSWQPPVESGGNAMTFETLRGKLPDNFLSGTQCIVDADPTGTSASDSAVPVAGTALYYLVRGVNDCPTGEGSLGSATSGEERRGVSCP